jgi:hypothetical protein
MESRAAALSKPQRWGWSGACRGLYADAYEFDPWDISPDGKRFLMMKETGSTASGGGGPRKINIGVNWLEELKQRVPVK